jgi:hypothetical protein
MKGIIIMDSSSNCQNNYLFEFSVPFIISHRCNQNDILHLIRHETSKEKLFEFQLPIEVVNLKSLNLKNHQIVSISNENIPKRDLFNNCQKNKNDTKDVLLSHLHKISFNLKKSFIRPKKVKHIGIVLLIFDTNYYQCCNVVCFYIS